MIRVLVVDDQAIVRDGLVTLLGLLPDVEVVGEATDGAQALDLVGDAAPDVVLMDLRMPVLDGTAATARLRTEHPEVAVLVLTTYGDDASIAGALAAGARGYLTKDAGRTELAAAVRAAAAGHVTLGAEVGARVLSGFAERLPTRERFPALTAREDEVLDRIVAGESNAEIAARLFLSVSTVKSYVNDVFSKLGARDRAHAVAIHAGRSSGR
jgi:DNA-binding NarL/FixJ family response regulator